MSARQRRRINQRNRKISISFSFLNKKVSIAIVVSLCIVIITLFAFALGNKKFWDGTNKLAIAVRDTNGVSVLLFDPQYEEVVKIHIPEHTEVSVAYGLGVWKIESLWELGKQQNIDGKVLAGTITKHFHFPVSAWADTNAMGLASGNISELYSSVFGIYASNLSLGDRIALAWFSFNIPNAKHIEIDLAEAGYLQETTLSDGTKGYVKVEPQPAKIMSLFADQNVSKNSYAVSIEDATGEARVAKNVGQVVEVLGAKVAAITDRDEKDFDCLVKGKNKEMVLRMQTVFNCEKEEGETNFDVEILLGSQFAKRF